MEAQRSLMWDAQEEIEAVHMARVAVPFDYAASKNAIWRTGRGGHIYAREEGRKWREALTMELRASGNTWFQGKIWVDIFVEKPNHKGDAANVLDTVLDAVKEATGVDDRWYSIRRLDWAIGKVEPRVIVGVYQAITEDHRACSYCGRELPYSDYGPNRHDPAGIAKICKDCSRPVRGRAAA